MKFFNRFFTLLLTAAVVLLVPLAGSITVSAAEPKIFQMKYIEELGAWRTQCLPSWDDNRETGSIEYLLFNAADGDLVVINAEGAPGLDITFQQELGNLTIFGGSNCIIVRSDKKIKDLYIIQGSIAAINCDVENAYIYDNCACNLNKNAKNVYVTAESKMEMNVAALGSVEKCVLTDLYGNATNMYNIQENALRIVDGYNTTDPQKYSTDPAALPAITTPVITTAEAPAAPSAPAADPAAPLSPATGEKDGFLLPAAGVLFCLAATCLAFTRRRKKA